MPLHATVTSRAASSHEHAERMHRGDDEREERLSGGVGVRHEHLTAGPQHGRRLEVLADPAGHEQILVSVRVEERRRGAGQAEASAEREERRGRAAPRES